MAVVVNDLASAASTLEAETGIMAVPGGRHPGHGTANFIAPLGENYIELVAVVDPLEADGSVFGRWLMERLEQRGAGPGLLCLRSEELDRVCSRLGLEAAGMSRARPDGTSLSWRIAGLEEALGTRGVPFYIEWPSISDQPGRSKVGQAAETRGLVEAQLTGDSTQLESRAGGVPGVTIRDGEPDLMVVLDVEGSRVDLSDVFVA